MTESRYTQSIHAKLPKLVYKWKVNARFAGGVPDAWYSGPVADIWVEYKFVPRPPKTKPLVPELSALQKKWLNDRHDEGRNVAVIVGTPDGSLIYRDKSWNTGMSVKDATLLTKVEVANWITNQVSASDATNIP